jgi:glycosyltransferase involved in cell wall biosynthesis
MNKSSLQLPRVAINGWFWSHGNVGMSQYIRFLVQSIAENYDELELIVITPNLIPKDDIPDTVQNIIISLPFPSKALSRLWFEQIAFPRACSQVEADIIHIPYYGIPLWQTHPTIATIHDIIPLIFEPYKKYLALRFYSWFIRKGLQRTDLIITDSEHSKQDLIKHLTIDSKKITTIYPALAHQFEASDLTLNQQVLAKYNLPEQYILYLGGYEIRKNVDTLLKAYS